MNNISYDIDYLTRVIEYNKNRYNSFKNGVPFLKDYEIEKTLNARYHKVGRVKRRFLYLLSRYKYIWFVTFTFDNYYINKSSRTKRDLIKQCINKHDFKYILNIDYGSQTEREHYHCILATNEDINIDDFMKTNYKCFSCSILCKNGLEDFKRLSKYINKLVNHCLKATTKNQRLVYNFKGYDLFCPTYRDITITYNLEFEKFFQLVPLLDKGDITGKI